MIKVGQKLQEERTRQGLTIDAVSKATKIKTQFLSAIERGEYDKLPSSAYGSGFVRNYIEFLGLPEKETMALFRREFDAEKIYKVLPEGLSHPGIYSPRKVKIGQTVTSALVILFLLVGYILFQNRYAIINPPLDIQSPKEGTVISRKTIEVIGQTDSNATVYVNNDAVFLEKDGSFKKNIDVFPGKSTIQIRAVNRFGKETKIERHIEVK